jgi:putative transcriptional regulator
MSYHFYNHPHKTNDKRVSPTPRRYYSHLGSHLWVRRYARNLTQRELAEKAGVSRKTINAIETSKTLPTLVVAMKIATALDIAVEDLFFLNFQ